MHQERADFNPFALPTPGRSPLSRSLFSVIQKPVESLLGLERLQDIYQAAVKADQEHQFCDRVLDVMGVRYEVSERERKKIPTSGPVIVVANHPYGAIEGVMLGSFLRSIRPDATLMANFLLYRIPQLRDLFIPVDPFGGRQAAGRNRAPLKAALTHLKQSGLLGIFPSGEVSHFRIGQRTISDPPWSETIGRLVRLTGATVVPVYFDGCNGFFFQFAGLLHPRLRTILLPHEMINKQSHRFRLQVGSPIPASRFSRTMSDREIVEYLRMRTYLLKRHTTGHLAGTSGSTAVYHRPVAGSLAAEKHLADIANLPADALLARIGSFAAYAASAAHLPSLLHEIACHRERTFRAVGEGTGRPLDRDQFDKWYDHVFIWDHQRNLLVGAYRVGRTDQILRLHGMRGLYTKTLFQYNTQLLRRIGPALELGRSFIRPEYQKEYLPLHLLWRGICQYVARHPQYRTLYGPVSISSRYQSISQQLLLEFLRDNCYASDLAQLVRAKTPPKQISPAEWNSSLTRRMDDSIENVDSTIAEIERGEIGMPILLRQYLRLGGRLLGFNLDHAFHDCIDGLILVDLPTAPRRVLDKYFGREQAECYLDYHASVAESARSTGPVGPAQLTADRDHRGQQAGV